MTLFKISDALSVSFMVDNLSIFFMILITFIFGLVIFYAIDYMKPDRCGKRFFVFFLLTYVMLMLLAVSANAVTMYMCFEFMAMFSTPLVLHDNTPTSRAASIKYLGYSTLGAALALFGFFIVWSCGASLDFVRGGNPIPEGCEAKMQAAYFLIFIGFGCKAGLVPFQLWLTEAHPVAPAPAHTVLSGVVTKVGVLGIIRATFFMFGADFVRGSWMQKVLLVMVLVTIFFGSMLALKEHVIKKRLAYSTISQVSYVLFGILLLNTTAFEGALLHIVFHALAKGALFLSVGSVIFRTDVHSVEEFFAIGKRMPITMGCFALGSLSLVGIPPFGGFTSKWYLAMGALQVNSAVGMIGTVVLLVSALLTAFYLFPVATKAFFPGKDYVPGENCEITHLMMIPLVSFAVLSLVLGIFPNGLCSVFSAIAESLM